MLLRVQLPLAAAHGCDEGSPLAAAILGEQEVDVTFWGKFLHRLLEDPREAEGREQQETVVRRQFGAEVTEMRYAFEDKQQIQLSLKQDEL